MFSIDEYYLGVIVAEPSRYDKTSKNRYYQGYSFDPFYNIPLPLAISIGVVTLLHKIENRYYDEYYSIYKNELYYEQNASNSLGIMLVYAKPFRDYYKEEPIIYEQEELENSYKKMEEVFNNHSYYITHNKTKKSYAIVQLDMEPMKLVTRDYVLEQTNGFTHQKKR